jgi:hypothetical protein
LALAIDVIGLGGKSDDQARPARFAVGDGRKDIGIFHQLERRRPTVLLDLALARLPRAPVGDGGGEHGDIGRQRLLDRREHLLRGFHANNRHARRIGQIHRALTSTTSAPAAAAAAAMAWPCLPDERLAMNAHRIDRLGWSVPT